MLTPKQETYCQERNKGLSQRQAYLIAYPRAENWKPESVDRKATELENNVKVLSRLRQLREESAKAAKLDKSKYLKGIEQLFNASYNVMGSNVKNGMKIDRNAADSMLRAAKILIPEAEAAEAMEQEKCAFSADFALLIQPDLFSFHRDFAANRHSDYWLKGGRGSTKSSAASLEVVNRLEANQQQHAVVLMKYATNLRQGVLSQVEWAIGELGVENRWVSTKSPMEITNTETGQKIFFRGCDDPRKLKSSIKPPFGYIGVIWYEEADLFQGMKEIRSVNQTLSRGGDTIRLYTFNPPRSRNSWINSQTENREGVYESCYKNVPIEWLGKTFFDDAFALKAEDEQAYRHEYLGEPVGLGTEVFDRVEFRTITDDEIKAFDNPRLGQDFGWYPDPWAFAMSEWRHSGRTLLTYCELGGNKVMPDEQARMILDAEKTYELFDEYVFSDDAEPQTIQVQRALGVNARKSDKGRMRSASYKFLQSVHWVIDPDRCPRLANEVRNMQYEITPDGEVLNRIPDGNDHWVDAVRYSMMRDVRNGRDAYL